MESITTAGSDNRGGEVNEDVIQDGEEEGYENGMNMGENEDPEGCIINEWTENDNDFLPFIEQENICLNLDSDEEWDLDEDCKDKDMKEESFEGPEMSFDEEFQENIEYMEKAEINDKVEHVKDPLVEDNLGQPIVLVMVKDEFMEEKVKKYVKIKGFPWWPAFFKQEGNIATFLDNQIGHPLEVMDFTDANKEWILSRVHFSKKTGSNKAAFLCDYAKVSNM